MQQPPTPARKRVLIPSTGYPQDPYENLTWHVFDRAEREPDPEFGDLKPQYALIFKCEETGAERKYGVQDATPATDAFIASEGMTW